jgi:hypothetical protein
MNTWPLISRNKVEDSKVCIPVERCTESENVVLKKAARDVRAAVFLQFLLGLTSSASFLTNGAFWRLLTGYRSD